MTISVLRPWCPVCGWRRGGLDSWDGRACKCGDVAPPLPHDRDGQLIETLVRPKRRK